MNNRLKNVLFHFFGITLFSVGFALCIWFGNLVAEKDRSSEMSAITIGVFFFLIYNLVTMGFISQAILDGKKTVLNYFWHFRSYMNVKWVCHSELGYFPTIIGKRRLSIYQQNIFSVNKLTSIDIEGVSIERISDSIKSHLDWVYKNSLADKKEAEIIKAKQNEIKKWDGYLDVPTRRDKKIDQLLK